MEMSMEQTNKKFLYRMLYVLAAVVTLFPVSCDYIMIGGIITEWISRMEEIAIGGLRLFPTAEAFVNVGIWDNAMNSNLWFFFPALLYRFSGNLVLAYRIYILALQVVTALCSFLFFRRVLTCKEPGKENEMAICLGVILYMTCPYRIFVCYDWANLSEATAWMLLPLYGWAVVGLLQKKKSWVDILVAASALAGIGYAEVIYFLSLVGITLLIVLFSRKLFPLLPLTVGVVLAFPGLYRLFSYLFFGDFSEGEIMIHTIMQEGYRFGQFFSSYAFRDGHPGFGLGIMICLLAGLWLRFVIGGEKVGTYERFFIGLAILLLMFSLRYFPWDFVQRLGVWTLKLVSVMGTPAVFAGLGYAALCVPAAGAAGRIGRYENRLVAGAVPLIILITSIGLCVYQCNMLTDTRAPLRF
ncbi:MAG: hypothetical protein J1E64_05760 [Acetatifactor sp.]|nr:hypothetical protein [Acetatifactor sp.]